MSDNPLEERPSEVIKAHFLDPENSPLPVRYQEMLNRAVSLTKLLDKHPVARNAIKYHRVLYPEISQSTAYTDLTLARKLFNNYQDFDYDFWLSWTLGDITANIEKCRSSGLSSDRKIIAMEHANLGRILGKRPDEPVDPLRNEKHNFYIMVNIKNKNVKLDLNTLHKLPLNTIQDLTRALLSDDEIDDQGAAEIMNS
jgi:hypothetical protein